MLAHDVSNVNTLLWASDQNPSRDGAGGSVKSTIPTIVNGRVYDGSLNAVNVYGLLPASATAPIFTPTGGTYAGAINVTLANAASNATIY